MNNATLPPLPGAATIESQRRYSADQMRAYARDALASARGKDCPSCRDSDSWGIADRASCAGCAETPDGKGTLYVPLNGPRA